MNGTIYRIHVLGVEKCYIGRTTQNIKIVLSAARSNLKAGKHSCKPLQAAATERNIRNVSFSVLEEVDEAELVTAQLKWMKKYKCFNKKVATKPRKARSGVHIRWNKIDYPSYNAASRATGLSIKQLRLLIEAGYENDGEYIPYPFTPDKIPVEWEGVMYESITAGSKATGFPYASLRKYHSLGITTRAALEAYRERHRKAGRKQTVQSQLKYLQRTIEKKQCEIDALKAKAEELKNEINAS